MPFAPATLDEHRDACYRNVDGAEYAAQFMTLTFDCTDEMKRDSPGGRARRRHRPAAARDGRRRTRASTAILTEYHRLDRASRR